MSESVKPFILVDGSSYLFRAYHALPPLMTSHGQPTGAIYGVMNMLRKLQNDYAPEYMAVIFDPRGPTFRKEMYAEYKANREKMPDELAQQIEPLHKLIKASGMPLIIVDGVEADDVIGTLVKQAEQQGLQTLVSTGDKDMAQLVNEQVTLVNTMTDKVMDIEGVQEKFGVKPEQIIDYLTLVGDTSDNIPGVPKVGPKTAAKWLQQYGSLENIIEHAEEIKGKVGENLRNHLSMLPLARDLVTIKTDVTLEVGPAELKLNSPDNSTLLQMFQNLEFKRWIAELQEDTIPASEATQDYTLVLDQKVFDQWVTKLQAADEIAFDTEATSLDAMRADMVGLSFAVKQGEAAYVPVAHTYSDAPAQLDRQQVLAALQPILNDPTKTIVGQNLKYDLKILRQQGIEIQAKMRDTLLESYVLNSTSSRHDMDTLAITYLGHATIKYEDVAGKGAKQVTFDQVDLAQAGPYAAEDADITLQLDHKLMQQITAEESCLKVFNDIEMPLMPVLMNMEYNGVLIDKTLLEQQSEVLAKRLTELKAEVFTIAGEEFNLDSPKQLQHILFEKLKIPIIKKTPKGQPSTAEPVMQELALDYPLPKLILEYRSLSKLKSTYTDKLPLQINPHTGRVHTHYNQAVTSTGRLSSKDPNLQNIPVRTEEGRKIRKAFIAPPGHKIVAADYSQVELRIMAHLSGDPTLLKAFANGLDVHRATAAEVFGVKHDEVTPEQRRHAKAINFGLMYGMSAFGLSRQLNVGRDAAQEYMDVYFHRYPKVHDYMEQARKMAAKKGYVETLFGRRLYVPDIKSNNTQRRMAAERAAINAPLQGTAADIIKLAMLCIQDWLDEADIQVRMIMQVHDELVFEVAEALVSDAQAHIRGCMEGAVQLDAPLLVDIGVGVNWDEAH